VEPGESHAVFLPSPLTLTRNTQCSYGLPDSAQPLYLLGERYNVRTQTPEEHDGGPMPADEAEVERLWRHWLSCTAFTYRTGMPPLPGGLTTDVGWGCTLRSGQMLLARALTVQCLGPEWRWSDSSEQSSDVYAHILRLFNDAPESPCGLHALVRHGAPCGVKVGFWLGPHVVCNAIQALVRHNFAPGQLNVCVLSSGGGGAPTLYRSIADECRSEVPGHSSGAVLPPNYRPTDDPQRWTPVLLLVPLVLGLGHLNMVYAPQLCKVLAMRKCCGIVGGRPGSSLFFVGCIGESVLYLDPHDVQAHVANDDPESDVVAAHQCGVIRHTPLSSIDPSMALAFYAATHDEFAALCDELQQLEHSSAGAPLLTVASSAEQTPLVASFGEDMCDEGAEDHGDWVAL
jgi:cysteine protease ATG4